MVGISGRYDPAFRSVRDVFAEQFTRPPDGAPAERGAAVCVVLDGSVVVDLWAGHRDEVGLRPWTRDTVCCAFSCTKGLVALGAHMLVDRGLLDYDTPVAAYWPEFAAGGKDAITVRHLLAHQAGLAQLGTPLGPGGVWDWQRVVDALAAAEPQWQPGTAHGYHTFTFGHLVGEVIRRVDGRDPRRFVREEIAEPLGVVAHVGLPPDAPVEVADLLEPPEGTSLADVTRAARTLDPTTIERYDDVRLLTVPVANSEPFRRSQIPGANGHTNARALARTYGALARGGSLGGVRLVSPTTLAHAREVQATGPDRTIGSTTQYLLGWQGPDSDRAPVRGTSGFGHGGAYGSIGWADPDARMGFGYVANQCGEPAGDQRGKRLLRAALDCV